MLGLVLTLLFAPRVLALGCALLRRRPVRDGFGGRTRLLASALLDQVFGLLLGPVMPSSIHASSLTTLAGRIVRWDAQPRDDRGLGWSEAARQFGGPLALGAVAAAALATLSPFAAAMMAPGLLLGIPFAVWTSRGGAAHWARRLGLFTTPEEMSPPAACGRWPLPRRHCGPWWTRRRCRTCRTAWGSRWWSRCCAGGRPGRPRRWRRRSAEPPFGAA